MPCISGYIKGAKAISEVGQYTPEGLPNITGHVRAYSSYNQGNASFVTQGVSGAFYWQTEWDTDSNKALATSQNVSTGTSDTIRNVPFDASRSNSIYGNSTHVTPETVAVLFGVYAIGTVVSIGEATEEGIVAELGNINNQVTANWNNTVNTVNGVSPINTNVDVRYLVRPEIPQGADLNTYSSPGAWRCGANVTSATFSNCPTKKAFVLDVTYSDGGWVQQFLRQYDGKGIWIRQNDQGAWSSWVQLTGVGTITATYSSGTNWYRKWSDGWIEQGGTTQNVGSDSTVTVSCITAFTTTNYNIVASQKSNGTKTDSTGMVLLYPTSTSSWRLHNGDNVSAPFMWYACGK